MKEIRVITDEGGIYDSNNIHGRDDIFSNTNAVFAVGDIKKEINNAINSVVDMVDIEELNKKGFDVSEMTFNLNINADGKVSLLSCVSGGISTQSGITIKIVRKGR